MVQRVKSYQKKDGTKVRGYAIYPKDRRTPILVDGRLTKKQAIKKALSIKKRGSDEIDLVRRLTEAEQKLADKGKWVRGHNVDKDRKSLKGRGPIPKNFNSFSNLIKFAKPYKPLTKAKLSSLLTAGKNWTKRNRLESSGVLNAVHDSMHVVAEDLRPKYRLAPINPKLIQKELSKAGTVEIQNPYDKYQRLEVYRKLAKELTTRKNRKVESYVSGLEGDKKIDKNIEFPESGPTREELKAYWLGRRDRKTKLPGDYKKLQKESYLTIEEILPKLKASRDVKPVGSVKGHSRRVGNNISRVRAYKKRQVENPTQIDLSDFMDFSNYSNPELREKIKSQVMSSPQGGKPGQWSAIKSNILAKKYKEAGGKYTSEKGKEQKKLDKWNKEDWQYSDGKKSGGKGRYRPKKVWDKLTKKEKDSLNQSKYKGKKQFVPIPSKIKDKVQPPKVDFSINHRGEIFSGINKPKKTPNHPTKSHAVLIKDGSKKKIVRFGQQGVVGSPKKEGESRAYANRRKSFKSRHAKNIKKGKTSAAFWANKIKW